mmetsp:Transcript_1546/g.6867  ORF Transcript_1546/g.6867 Transcript_1546/m.6867 type:complete len:306 (-) Transcript_1546:617-1534(-)
MSGAGPSAGCSSLFGSSSPRSSSAASSLLHPSLTFTPRSKNTGLPKNVSMSSLAAVLSSFSALPPLPIRIPIWLLRSQKIFAMIRSFFTPSRSLCDCTHTCVLYGTSCWYCKKIFSRIISAMKNRSGCSLMVSFGYSVGPSGRLASAHFCTASCPTPASALTGKTFCTPGIRSKYSLTSRISSTSSKSHLLTMTPRGAGLVRCSGNKPSNAPYGSRVASTMASNTSALAMAFRTDLSIISSSLLNSSFITPGVSRRTIWYVSSLTIPRILCRVVCGLNVTMESLVPTSWFSKVLFPALGRPTMAT